MEPATTLQWHHARLTEIRTIGMRALESRRSEMDVTKLSGLRAQMVDALASYQAFVHQVIYVPEAECDDEARRHRAQELKISCIQLGASYESFRIRWNHRHAADNWPEYRLSARKMAREIGEHIAYATALFAMGDDDIGVRQTLCNQSQPVRPVYGTYPHSPQPEKRAAGRR